MVKVTTIDKVKTIKAGTKFTVLKSVDEDTVGYIYTAAGTAVAHEPDRLFSVPYFVIPYKVGKMVAEVNFSINAIVIILENA